MVGIEPCQAHGVERVVKMIMLHHNGRYREVVVCWECARTVDNLRSWLWEQVVKDLVTGDLT